MRREVEKKIIVVSATNLVTGGTLKILTECLEYLSKRNKDNEYRVVAIVHKQELADFHNIEYIEMPWAKKRWVFRVYCEYITMYKISKQLKSVELWLSLHDTSPNVKAKIRAVYCHSSFLFYKPKFKELFLNYKIVMFAFFTRFIYLINQKKNNWIIVQQQWFKNEFIKIFHLEPNKIIVAEPVAPVISKINDNAKDIKQNSPYIFFYPASPNSHKNFELIGEAVKKIRDEKNNMNFKVYWTVSGTENKYAKWLYKQYAKNIDFIGFKNRKEMNDLYEQADCLLFPSKIETWGLPISEFIHYKKPILTADLAYARAASGGSEKTAFFDPRNPIELKTMMMELIKGNESFLKPVKKISVNEPFCSSWQDVFELLLKENVT